MRISIPVLMGSFSIAASLSQAAAAIGAPVSIEEVMQAPYPSSLAASAKGNSIAWVFDTRGVRNIWVAQGGHARQITPYTLDDGFDIGDLAWSADGSELAYVRGGSIEDDQPANVNNSPEGPAPREVWAILSAGGAPRQSGDGSLAKFFARRQPLGVCGQGQDHDVRDTRRLCGLAADRRSGPHRSHDLLARRQEAGVRERTQGALAGWRL